MKKLELYLKFCRLFKNFNFPTIKFKKYELKLNNLCINLFEIDIGTINKAFTFLLSILSIIFTLILISFFPFFIAFTFSILLSVIISFFSSQIIFNQIDNERNYIEIILNFIKLDYLLIKKTYKSYEDLTLVFLRRLRDYKNIFNSYFTSYFKEIQRGTNPERILKNVLTPSYEFNLFLNNLTSLSSLGFENLASIKETTIDKNFKIYLKELDTKLSIFFFIGLFFPIGLCFLAIMLDFTLILTLTFIPLFFLLLKYLNNKFLDKNNYIIGKIYDIINLKKNETEEMILFFRIFGLNLQNKLSPEKSFIETYNQIESQLSLIKNTIRKEMAKILYLNQSLVSILKTLKAKLNSSKISLMLDSIIHMLAKNSESTGKRITEILKILEKQSNLEDKMITKLKSQKFRVNFFLFILPIILGLIGGMIPIFHSLTTNFSIMNSNSIITKNISEFRMEGFLIILILLLFSNLIVSTYFSKLVYFENKILVILSSNIIFLFTFFVSLIYIPFF